ncbi:disease resistance-like protein DSC2 isoform X2 [Syzygium oleosum]|uniref:disease resistance-like protein DSC2 isoform X2 n=1 Tax=Syzygium oleosum TaxID=219896 RepID=UPI0024B96A16|nr:disease resistance-like protein DSC2 isoform X2 [Syzygium oleosum]
MDREEGAKSIRVKKKPMDDALALRVSRAGPVGSGSTRYDVFLSFTSGSDAAHDSFSGHLHASLTAAGVSVCGPDERQAIGSSSRLPDEDARRSKICIPILSEDYPSSERCLRGLVQMMEGKKSARQKVFPIFNGVKPSDVRNLRGSFGKSFHSRGAEDIKEELRALKDVSLLHGWRKVTDGSEEELVTIVVQTVIRCLQPNIPKGPRIARYNVFLNFRGADTREGFTYHLYTNLVDAGVSVFKDDIDLPIGEEFRSQLLSAITRSTIYIAVLSQNYASSKWCLHELTKMMECQESMGHIVLPIYYKVDPSDVRRQKGNLGSFRNVYYSREKGLRGGDAIMEGLRVLEDVCNLKGLHHHYKGSDGELIKVVVQGVLRQLRHHFQLDVPEHLVRIDDHGKQIRLGDVEDSTPTHECLS